MCKLTELKGSVNIAQATWSENGGEQILRSYTKVLLSEDGVLVRQSQKVVYLRWIKIRLVFLDFAF